MPFEQFEHLCLVFLSHKISIHQNRHYIVCTFKASSMLVTVVRDDFSAKNFEQFKTSQNCLQSHQQKVVTIITETSFHNQIGEDK